ncbi:FtsX-like permease family protein [Streptomyces bluensis]|uniref:FtsX-like permease family protein n=1 Tax=Streptomyces bluensis TaxID=33897 RepID=UPI0010632448|nr:FtsX-like permease family protein [Streptomyces bluensis]GGZ80704.1 ABC transporter substrate-binding protein [Streptomyces bluensis]
MTPSAPLKPPVKPSWKPSWRASVLGSQLAELLRRPGRLLTTGLSVLVAAFVVFATVMAQQIATNTTVDRFRGTPEAVSLIATADDESSTTISDATLERIRALPGVAEAVGRVDAGAPIAGPFERYLQLYADPGTGPLSQVELVKGSYPDGAGQIAVNRQAAEELQLAPGTRTTLLFPDPEDEDGVKTVKVTVTVTGVVRSTATAVQLTSGYTTDTHLARLAEVPGYPRVDIRARSGVPQDELSRQVRAVLDKASSGASLTAGSAVRAEEARAAVNGDLREVFQLIAVFLAVAVGAAALVATSTFRIVFAQRLRQLALLRAIGAPQPRLVTALAVEGALVGVVAGVTGVLTALGAGHLAPPAARLLAGQELSAPGLPVLQAVLVVVGTVLVTVCAVLAPALSAAGVSPLQALRTAGTVTGERRVRPARLATGILLAAAATGLAALILGDLPEPGQEDYDRDFAMMVTVASAGFAFLALITLGPLLVRPVLAVAGWPLRRLGTTGRLAVSGVGGTPHRAAAVSVVVALGVALVSGALVSVACLSGYMERTAAVEAPADFRVAAGGKGLDASLVRQFAASPQLTHVTGYRTLVTTVGNREIEVSDLEPDALPTGKYVDTATGSLDDLGPGHAVVASDTADLLGVRAGDTFTLPSGRGGIRLTVAATLPGQGPLQAGVLVAPADLDRMGASRKVSGILADAAAEGLAARGEAHRALETTIRAHVPDPDDISVSVLAAGRDSSQDTLRTMGTTALGLVALTVLIAVVGVTATTSLTAIERTREFGLLRALGLGGGALRRTIATEAGLYGVLGGVLGLALGVPYAWLLMRVVVTSAPLRLPAGHLLVVFTGLAALTALAGLLPARRATRVTPMTALGGTE